MAKSIPFHAVAGFKVSALSSGIKSSAARDIGLIVADEAAVAAAVFTSNQVCAAPVKHSRAGLRKSKGRVRAILVNSGNANCCTGKTGTDNARTCAQLVARAINCQPHEVLLASTGIIGEQLPMAKAEKGIDKALSLLASKKATDKKFADAIRTLDTFAKEFSTEVTIGGKKVRIAAAAKGIGMCAPDMATVLIFILTDAKISQSVLQAILKATVDKTFNRVSVDSDTSTNDSCFLLASGKAGNATVKGASSKDGEAFAAGLNKVCFELAKMLARDGEGAETYLEVRVNGAKSKQDAEVVSRAICESPLVKAAVNGADPNWGRIMMAAGKCEGTVREKKCAVKINKHLVFSCGAPTAFNPKLVSKAMKGKEVIIELDLGIGKGKAVMFGCDLTHGYVTINADYHT